MFLKIFEKAKHVSRALASCELWVWTELKVLQVVCFRLVSITSTSMEKGKEKRVLEGCAAQVHLYLSMNYVFIAHALMYIIITKTQLASHRCHQQNEGHLCLCRISVYVSWTQKHHFSQRKQHNIEYTNYKTCLAPPERTWPDVTPQ